MSNIETDILTLTDTSTIPQLSSTTSETTTPAADINGSKPDSDSGYNSSPSISTSTSTLLITTTTTSASTSTAAPESDSGYKPIEPVEPEDSTNAELNNHLTLDYSDCKYVIINKLYKIDNKYDKEVFVIDIYNNSYKLPEDSSISTTTSTSTTTSYINTTSPQALNDHSEEPETQTLDSFEIEINNYFTIIEEKLTKNSKDVNYKVYGYNHLNEKLKEEIVVLSYNEDYNQNTMSTTLKPDQTTTQIYYVASTTIPDNSNAKCGYIIYKDNKFIYNYEYDYSMSDKTLYSNAMGYIDTNCKIGGKYDVLVYIDDAGNNVFSNHIYTYNLIINDINKIVNNIYNPIISFINTENTYKTNTYYTKNFTIEFLTDTFEPITIECSGDSFLSNSFLPGTLRYNIKNNNNVLISSDVMYRNSLSLNNFKRGDIIELYTIFDITDIVGQSYNPSNGILKINTAAKIKVYGNIMSLLRGPYPDMFGDHSVYRDNIFKNLFKGCTGLVSAKNLILSSMKITSGCYESMFEGCTLLFEAPMLPALSLSNSCYDSMFKDCESLKNGPDLPAQNTAEYCYNYMFYNCKSLVYAPDINGKTAHESMCVDMFANCKMLENPPKLNPLEVKYNAYNSMFSGCTSLKTAPKICGIYLEMQCYMNMFNGCTSLINAPILNAGNPYYSGYISDYCYYSMFKNCESLVVAPELPAYTLKQACYGAMFENCRSLCYVKMAATDINGAYCLYKFMNNVNNNGLFIKNLNTNIQTGVIPEGWTVKNYVDYRSNYFTIVSLEDGLIANLSIKAPSYNAYEYRIDDGSWNTLSAGSNTPSINKGQTISFRGNLTPNSMYGIGTFTVSKAFNVEGNIMSLLYGDDFIGQNNLSGKDYAFYYLFGDCTTLKNAKNLILPATTLASGCYAGMFSGCTGLTTPPELPATTLTSGCYAGMFSGCTGLTTPPELPATTLTNECYSSMFSGCTGLTTPPELPATTLTNECYSSMFSGCTGLTTPPELPATTLTNECYSSMFSGCTGLISAPELPATTLADYCYDGMFNGTNILPDCSNIDFANEAVVASGGLKGLFSGTKVTDADLERILPKNSEGNYYLPITTLADECYMKMFYECTELTTAPKLPATTLANSCYMYMFYNCTSLTTVPELPATTLADSCYYNMFYGCTRLISTPELPATTLAERCYEYMFYGCTSLTSAPELPATTLANSCYSSMFDSCTSLTSAPELPATTLARECYAGMFYECTSLVTAPELPATTLASNCYSSMFSGCTHLTSAPELPATTLARNCYIYMFYGCTGLTSASELPAATLVSYCYYNMFYGCSKLNYIKMLATFISASNCLNNWVNGVALAGTFIKHPDMTTLPSGASGIPEGWTVEDCDIYTNSYFTIKALEDGLTVSLSENACEYRIDNGRWNTLSSGSNTPSINKGQTLSFRGNLKPNSNYLNSGIGTFIVNKAFNVEGNIMSLLYGDNFKGQKDLSGKNYVFNTLFQNCQTLKNAKNLILPATTLASNCYSSMFSGCTGLISAPELPATTLANECYYNMFYGCTGLTTAPELPATTLADKCYSHMFASCTGLTTAPKLPATTLASNCYSNMFDSCRGLTSAPKLPATTLASSCYSSMFTYCTGLTTAPELPATTLVSDCYRAMFASCTGLTTAPELHATTLPNYCYSNMFYGCTGLTSAPELPATTLTEYCYDYMFYGCSKLNYIKMLATDIRASNCLKNWVSGVAPTGTFVKHKNMTSLPSGASGIPEDWIIVSEDKTSTTPTPVVTPAPDTI